MRAARERSTGAFSLMEMVIVIAILGILATLLLSGLSRATGRARQIYCLNNVRQLGQGMALFVVENRRYPLYVDPLFPSNGPPTQFNTWTETLNQQLQSAARKSSNFWDKGVWLCPGVESKGELQSSFNSYGYNAYGVGTQGMALGLGGTYGVTHVVQIGSIGYPVVKPAVVESAVLNPSEMMAIGDGFDGNGKNIFSGSDLLWRHDSYSGFFDSGTASKRHMGKANIVFCDGHLESPTLESLFVDRSDASLREWNRDHEPHGNLLP